MFYLRYYSFRCNKFTRFCVEAHDQLEAEARCEAQLGGDWRVDKAVDLRGVNFIEL